MGLKNLSIKAKLIALSALFVGGMAIVGLVAFAVLSEVKIGGAMYSQILLGNQMKGNYNPPDGYLMGPRLEVLVIMSDLKRPDLLKRDLERFEQRRQRFEEVHQQSLNALPEGQLKDLMNKAYEPGHQYLELAKETFIPLLLQGKSEEAEPTRLQLQHLFAVHDEAESAFSELNNQELTAVEKAAAETVVSRTAALIVVALIAVALVLALFVVIAKGIVKPLRATEDVLHLVSRGDLTQRMEVVGDDEIAHMGKALNETVDTLSRIISGIGADANALTAQAEELSATGEMLGASAHQTTSQAAAVSEAAEQVSLNVQTVSSATEEMSTSISEISKNASEAAQVASSAARLAGATTATMTKLSESSAEIGNVIKVITSIAAQTNLLALNATIEAARAGAAGKGFAVVANEVKELAKETAKATEDIGAQVQAIQNDAKSAVGAIEEITTVIGRINDIQNTIASAVEEQTGTTNEIARNIAETVSSSSAIANNIGGVAKAAAETQETAGSSQQAALHLTELAAKLNRVVGEFKLPSNGYLANGAQR
jgi:methyl-accepting chemotaxis protein